MRSVSPEPEWLPNFSFCGLKHFLPKSKALISPIGCACFERYVRAGEILWRATSWLSALVRNYGDVFGGASGRRSKSFLFDFGEESGQIFASEGPLKGRGGFLVPSLKG